LNKTKHVAITDQELIKLLRSHGRRTLLRNIIELGITTASELVRRTGLRRQTVYEYLSEFEKAGLVEVRRDQRPWIVIFPEDLKENRVIRSLILEREVEKRKVKYTCTWEYFPECLIRNNQFKIVFVWGTGTLIKAKAHDALGIPEVVKELIFYAYNKGIDENRITVQSSTDEDIIDTKLLQENLFIIGSGIVNIITTEIMKIYDLPIRFEPPMGREIYSAITQRVYSAGDPLTNNAAIIALLPNPWNPNTTITLAAGIFRFGTMAAVDAIYKHILTQRKKANNKITPHPLAKIPIRIVKASPKGKITGYYE